MKELTLKYVPELNCIMAEYGTFIAQCEEHTGGELRIPSLWNQNRKNLDFIHGFKELFNDFLITDSFSSLHVVTIENEKLYRYLMTKYNFQIVDSTHLKYIK